MSEFNFVKFTFGCEMIAPDDKLATLKSYEEKIFQRCEKVVNKRAEQLRKTIEELE